MKLIVTGGAGFIGSRIVKLLIKNNHSVTVIDNLHTGRIQNLEDVKDKIQFINEDIRNFEKLDEIIDVYDGIFHEAALTLVQESFIKQSEYNEVNAIGTENIFKIAHKKNIKVIFASSSSVYGNQTTFPIKESAPKNPLNPYGESKLQAEKFAKQYSDMGVKIIGLRYFNVFGIGQIGSYAGVITKFINRLKNKESPQINGDGKQIRDFIFVEDVAEANIEAMNSPTAAGFFNIGTGIGTSIQELAENLIQISKEDISPEYLEELVGDIKFSQADVSLTEKTIGWKSKTGLYEGLEKIYPNF